MTIRIPDFAQLKNRILVVGDVMLDRYWHGSASRISPEAPVPVVHVKDIEERPGGAGNVALNLTALGCQANLLGITGDDEIANTLCDKLEAANVGCDLLKLPNIPTITKLRILSQHQQLIRLDFEESLHLSDTGKLIQLYKQAIADVDIIILSDYAKGTLACAKELIQIARAANIPVLVDPKGCDFKPYHGATIITPNFKEFTAVMGDCPDEKVLLEKGQQAIAENDLTAILVTRGAQGMTLIQRDGPEVHLPAHAREVFDVTGAGDTVVAMFAAALAAGEPLDAAMNLANWAASIAVGKMGAATVSLPELRRAILSEQRFSKGIMSEEQLQTSVEAVRAHGERIVMTNGCFDILHAGHVAYLERAKKQGDHLIVAINDDKSVARLKGASRPINSLQRRMAVLAGLASVDWVVAFNEDTPERLLELLQPDVLVKGGDYGVDEVVGAPIVQAYGGDVKVLDLVEGCSTTNTVNKLHALVDNVD